MTTELELTQGTQTVPVQSEENEDFSKSLGLFDATAIVAGCMIGSGIFIVSADIARQVDSAFWLLVVWLVAGLMTLAGALSYGEFAASIPESGGQYVYLKKMWGEVVGFMYGWTLFLVIQTGGIAAISVAFAKFFNILCPFISEKAILFSTPYFSVSTAQVFAMLVVIGLTAANTRGVQLGALIQNVFTSTKIVALIGVIIVGLAFGFDWHTFASNFSLSSINMPDKMNIFSMIAVASVGALFASDSWNNVTFVAAEIKNPEKNLPKSLMLGTGLVILLYMLANLTYTSVLPVSAIQTSAGDVVASTLISHIFGHIGQYVIAVIILISAFGAANGMIMGGARVIYAMAKDGLFFSRLAKIDKNTHVPVRALCAQCLWVCLLITKGNYSQLLDYVIFTALLFYILTISGLFIFRKKYPDVHRPYKTMLYPYMPAFYVVTAAFTAINLLIYKPDFTWPGLIITLIGAPVYYLRRWYKMKKAAKASA